MNHIFARHLSIAAFLAVVTTAASQSLQTQNLTLQGGWNLIQFQVTPANPSPAAVFGGVANFKAIWYYDAATALWQVYQKPQGTAAQQADQGLVNWFVPLGIFQQRPKNISANYIIKY